MKTSRHFLFNAVMTAVCLIFLICMAVSITVWFRPLYTLDCKLLDIPAKSGYSLEVCLNNYKTLIDYNLVWGPDKLVFPDFPMSAEAEFHFVEVKAIFVAMQISGVVCFFLLIGGFLMMKKNHAYQWLRNTIFAAVAVVLVIGAGLVIDWDGTFVLMHKILFSNDFWLFNPATDPVITILPDGVFLNCAVMILVLIGIGFITCGLLFKKYKKKYN